MGQLYTVMYFISLSPIPSMHPFYLIRVILVTKHPWMNIFTNQVPYVVPLRVSVSDTWVAKKIGVKAIQICSNAWSHHSQRGDVIQKEIPIVKIH